MSGYVYVLKRGDDTLYVGSSSQIGGRLNQHESQRPWWDEVTGIEVTAFSTIELARIHEYRLIDELKPLHNLRTRQNHANGGPERRARRKAAHAAGVRCPDPICKACRVAHYAAFNAARKQSVAS